MAGLLDSTRPSEASDAAVGAGDADLEEYRRRLQALPLGDERQMSLDNLRYQRALTALREEMLTRARPAQMPGALGELSGLMPRQQASAPASPYVPPGLLSPGSNPAGTLVTSPTSDFSSRMTGRLSANVEDRRGDPSWVAPGWQSVAKWLSPEWNY